MATDLSESIHIHVGIQEKTHTHTLEQAVSGNSMSPFPRKSIQGPRRSIWAQARSLICQHKDDFRISMSSWALCLGQYFQLSTWHLHLADQGVPQATHHPKCFAPPRFLAATATATLTTSSSISSLSNLILFSWSPQQSKGQADASYNWRFNFKLRS